MGFSTEHDFFYFKQKAEIKKKYIHHVDLPKKVLPVNFQEKIENEAELKSRRTSGVSGRTIFQFSVDHIKNKGGGERGMKDSLKKIFF